MHSRLATHLNQFAIVFAGDWHVILLIPFLMKNMPPGNVNFVGGVSKNNAVFRHLRKFVSI